MGGAAWTPRREQGLRRASMALGTFAAVLLGEAVLRVAATLTPVGAGDLSRAGQIAAPPVAGECGSQRQQATLAALVRPSAVPDLVYELKPGLETCFQGVRVRTNAAGLRDGEGVLRPKAPGTYRILLLGDSHAFGWGLRETDTLGARLRAELEGAAGPRVEVVNAGVPGYNTGQEAAFLRTRGLAQGPDCVMVLFASNDLGLPTFLLRPRSALLDSRSLLLARLAGFFALGTRAAAWWESPTLSDQVTLMGGDRPDVPPEYAHLAGVTGYRRALRSIAQTTRGSGVSVVNVADYVAPDVDWAAIHREQEGLGLVHVEPGLDWSSPALWLNEHDPHLSPRGTAELARRVAAELKARGVCRPPS